MTDTSTNITLEDSTAFLMGMGEGSQIIIEAADAAKESWTELETTAIAGSDQITVMDDMDCEVGDVIAIASTDEWDEYEEFTVLEISDDGKTMTLDGVLENTHEGETLTYNNGLTGDDYLEWTVETRAEVALLSRNITIQGDADSVEDGFGGETMVMDGAAQYISGAEFYRMGKEGIVGSYPIHFHLLGDAEGQYVTNVSVHDTYNKGVTIHGTSNVLFEDNVIFNTNGHGLFLEDGAESGNQIIGNLIFATTSSDEDTAAIPTDATDVTSYWIENPDNILIGNVAAGSEENGFWIFPANSIHGEALEAGIGEMGSMSDLIFQDNVAHSNGEFGVSIEGSIDADTLAINEGGIQDGGYATIDGLLAYENDRHGLWAFTNDLIVENSMFVDNDFGGFLSKGANYINDSLFANNHLGLYLYSVGGSEVSGSHFEDNNGDVFVNTSTNLNTQHAFSGITSGDGEELYLYWGAGSAATNQRNVIDIDGSITGIAGATLTSGGDDWEFAAAPNAYYDEDLDGYVSEATVARTRVIVASGSVLNVTRSDGVSIDDYAYTSTYGSFIVPTASGMENDVAYLLDFEDAVPTQVRLTNQFMQDGESVIYEIPNVDSVGTIRNASAVTSFDALMAATSTSYLLQDDSIFVRIVASASDVGDLAVDEMLADYNTSVSVVISDIVTTSDFDAAPVLNADLLTAIASNTNDVDLTSETVAATLTSANDDFELERYENTADPTIVTDDMARWSDASNWDSGVLPGEDDIVVISEGQTIVLDQNVTVQGIIVDGGELIIEDDPAATLALSTDYLLVMNGGLFQAGYEADPLDTDFTLTLEGDDPDFDLEVTSILSGEVANTVFAADQDDVTEISAVSADVTTDTDSVTAQVGAVTVEQPDASTWFTVTFDETIEDPVVVMGPVSANGESPAVTSIRNVTETGFEFQIDEWDYLDGSHNEVEVSWIAASAGDYTLEDGRNISFGSATAENEQKTTVDLVGFDDAPVVFTQVTDNDGDAVTTRVTDSDAASFKFMMQEENAADGVHVSEDVYWFAVEEGDGTSSSAQNFERAVDEELLDLGIDAETFVFAAMQSMYGPDTAAIRYDISADDTVEVWVQEEQSLDTEQSHALEDVAVFQTSEDVLTLAIA